MRKIIAATVLGAGVLIGASAWAQMTCYTTCTPSTYGLPPTCTTMCF